MKALPGSRGNPSGACEVGAAGEDGRPAYRKTAPATRVVSLFRWNYFRISTHWLWISSGEMIRPLTPDSAIHLAKVALSAHCLRPSGGASGEVRSILASLPKRFALSSSHTSGAPFPTSATPRGRSTRAISRNTRGGLRGRGGA